jgi:hypothetical protein
MHQPKKSNQEAIAHEELNGHVMMEIVREMVVVKLTVGRIMAMQTMTINIS